MPVSPNTPSNKPSPSRTSTVRRISAVAVAVLVVAAASRAVTAGEVGSLKSPPPPAPRAELVNVPVVSNGTVTNEAIDFDSLSGRSGDLRLRILAPGELDAYPSLVEHLGDAIRTPGVHDFSTDRGAGSFAFVTLTPWQRKLGGYVNGYNVGYWPGEQRTVTEQYENPDGFIEVTRESAETRLSTHFSLRDFITHDQQTVWPKYVVLREDLIDKLELVLNALQSFGVATEHVVVLSGFRSPQYNARGVGEGMARSSRHQFGDAADIIIDANRDGRMDDLNFDGRVDFADVQVIDRAVALVEHKYPDLVGGLGLYHETGPSGPFTHIDVRGTRARWTNAGRRRGAGWNGSAVTNSIARPSGSCQADGPMAVLCQGRR